MIVTYIDYFEDIAVSHRDIRHVKGVDPGAGKKRFATFTTEDVITRQLRTKVGWPALLLELYEWQLAGSNMYDAKTNYAGAFSVLDIVNASKMDDELRAYTITENIIQDIIQKMWSDHYGPNKDHCTSPFQYLNLESNCVPIGPVFDNQFGWRYEFSFRPKLSRNLTQAPAAGVFI